MICLLLLHSTVQTNRGEEFKNYLRSKFKCILKASKYLFLINVRYFTFQKTEAIYWQIDTNNILFNKYNFLYIHIASSMTNHERTHLEVSLNYNYIYILAIDEIK